MFFDYGIDHQIMTYVFNGDLFNQRLKMSLDTYNYCIKRIMNKFNETLDGSTLYLNVGNHDEQSRYINPNSLEVFKLLSTESHKIIVPNSEANMYKIDDRADIMLVPYTEDVKKSKLEINKKLDKLKNDTYVFAHLGVANSVSGRWHHKLDGAYTLSDLGWSNKHVKSITLGHYHLKQTLKKSGNKEAWYQGDLVPINFNDVEETGMGSARGFDEIDLETGEHYFKPITDKLPTFNIINLEETKLSSDDIVKLSERNFVRLIVPDKQLKKDLLNTLEDYRNNIEIVVKHKIEAKKTLDINESSSDSEILSKYCDKYYKNVKKEALNYLDKIM